MKRKSALESRIRGWLPQEPHLTRLSQPTPEPIKPKPQQKNKPSSLSLIVLIIIAIFYGSLFTFQFSTVSIVVGAIMLAFAVAERVVMRTQHKKIYRNLRYVLIAIIVFVVCFASTGIYLFYTSGYPPTYVPQTSYPQVLDASITQYFQTVEDSASYRFLQAEHLGTLTFTGLTLHTSSSNGPQGRGWLTWTFYAKDVNVKITMGQSTGIPYTQARAAHFAMHRLLRAIFHLKVSERIWRRLIRWDFIDSTPTR
jgi:hypothetical protein